MTCCIFLTKFAKAVYTLCVCDGYNQVKLKAMKTIKIWSDDPSDRQLNEISRDVEMGMTVIMPTDTIYALACDALNSKAIDKICRLKGINSDKTNLSIICSDISMVSEYARFSDYGYRLMKELTPGPYTFLFKSASTLPKAFKGRKIVGVRIPDSNLDRKLVERLGHPMLSTSIHFRDDDYAVSPELIAEEYYDRVDIMIEGADGQTVPSTIIDCTGDEPVIVREGKGPVDLI